MGRKRLSEGKLYRHRVAVLLDDETYEKLFSLAAKERRALSSQVRFLLMCCLK